LIQEYQRIRNQAVHAQPGSKELLTEERVSKLKRLVNALERDVVLTTDDGTDKGEYGKQ
jgi:hypothetical protein